MSSFYAALMKDNANNSVIFVHSIVTAQTRLEYFGAFIVYISTVSNARITCDCVQFVSHKNSVYTCINIFNIYGRNMYMKQIKLALEIFMPAINWIQRITYSLSTITELQES